MNPLYRKISVALINTSLPEPYNSYGDHWKDGFEDAGCDVTVFSYSQIPWIPPRFDLYFFVEIRYKFTDIPWYLNPRVLYSWDSHVTGPETFIEAAKHYDKVLLASKIDVQTLKDLGVSNAVWIPEACNPRIHKNLCRMEDRSIQLGFIGNLNNTIVRNGHTKNDFIDHLKNGPYKLYHKTLAFGSDYTIAQNLIRVMFDRTIAHNIGTRIFESCAAGCVPLWSDTGIDNGIHELLIENAHYVPYNDTIEDLDRVLEELYRDTNRMKDITASAECHVLNNHTYAHRVLKVLDTVGVKPLSISC